MGSITEFGFGNRATVFRTRIAELQPNTRLVWECLGDVNEWNGTQLTWDLCEQEGKTEVCVTQGNWRSTDGWFALCNTTWGELMYRLKNHVEGKAPGP